VKQSSTDATEYNGVQLPNGLWVLSSIHDIQQHPKYFPEPHLFDPDRWGYPDRHSFDAFVAFTKGEKVILLLLLFSG
jgi:cytochrome P450